jgi:hypothetical protein
MRIEVLLIGFILVGGGILLMSNAIRSIRGVPVRGSMGMIVSLVIIATGIILLISPETIMALFGK